MGIKSNFNVYGDNYGINDLIFKTVTTTNIVPFNLMSYYPVDNLLSADSFGRYTNHYEHPLRFENIWQDHQRLQMQEQVNIWNIMMYRFWKLQQQQNLIPYYRNAWYNRLFNSSHTLASTLEFSEQSLNNWKPKRKRFSFTKEQVCILEKSFQSNIYLSYVNKRYLAYQLGVTERRVALWFHNRRLKTNCGTQLDNWVLNFRKLIAERMKLMPSNVMRS